MNPGPAEPWWKSAVFYQIYPRSFADGGRGAPGVGDLEGVRRHLDHLHWLGVDAIWVCPFYPSPMADFGYDIADHCDVDPLFGTLADFDRLVADAHDRGIRVLIDWVPNHTSDQHPWFVESRSSRDSPKRHWYLWRDRTNNWLAAFGGPAWTWDPDTAQWYLHLFLPQQPDLDWNNPEVEEAMHGVLRFWLDRGVDGARIDVVHGMVKDPALPDDPPGTTLPHASLNDWSGAHPVLRRLRAMVDSYPDERVLVGEVYLLSTRQVVPYLGHGDELHLAFDFTSLFAPWDARAWQERLSETAGELDRVGGWPTWTLSNHDNSRHRTRYGGSEALARAAAVLLLTLRGTPFLYAGEELGLEDAVVPADRVVDPGGRDPCRAPIPWDGGPNHGWEVEHPWLPWPPDAEHRNAETQRADPASILHLYRRLIGTRRASPALHQGSWRLLSAPTGVVAYERRAGDDHRVVAVNFTAEPATLDIGILDVGTAGVAGEWRVEVSSDGAGEGQTFEGTLGPHQAAVLRPD
ncbi:MAG: alpha-amylase family glycosyl hydrolase [Actinomycetota bacterium]|nr:alpha-amylase family glycosyl hydrolase [Actinomycetota bacterium]